jgi:hypothetical protein
MTQLTKLPTLQDLLVENEDSLKQNSLTVLLNQDPPAKWLVQHPMIRDYRYIPIEKIEYLLTRIFGNFNVEIRSTQIVAN